MVHLFARATALAAFVLIVAGASVTSTDSGLAVPDWPLSYGQWMPPMQGGVFFEHGHRMIASLVGLMTWILAWLAWKRQSSSLVRRLSWIAAGSVVVQGVLGGVTVLYGLAKPVSVVHACLGQALFSLLVFIAVASGPAWPKAASSDSGLREKAYRLGSLATAATAAVFLQLVLGASYRHGLLIVLPHLAGALAAGGLAWAAAYRALTEFPPEAGLSPVAMTIAGAVGLQMILGLVALVGSPVGATAHVGCGALILASCFVLTARARRLAVGPEPSLA